VSSSGNPQNRLNPSSLNIAALEVRISVAISFSTHSESTIIYPLSQEASNLKSGY
jgi:hypothetical protein